VAPIAASVARGGRTPLPAHLVDAVVALAVAVVQVGIALLATVHRHHPAPDVVAFALLAAGPLALLARRRHPAAVLGLTFA
jgi:hypothetical protein